MAKKDYVVDIKGDGVVNIYVLYFDGLWEQEIGLTLNGFKNENIVAVAMEDRPYITEGKQKLLPDKTLNQVDINKVDMFIIPGGDTSNLLDNQDLKELILKLNEKKKYIAGICGGTTVMAKYGILEGKRCTGGGVGITDKHPRKELFEKSIVLNEGVVVDDNLITSTGQSYVEFAVELYRLMNIYDREEDLMAEYRWLKNIK